VIAVVMEQPMLGSTIDSEESTKHTMQLGQYVQTDMTIVVPWQSLVTMLNTATVDYMKRYVVYALGIGINFIVCHYH
jgi:hypothetical protein